MRADSFLRLWVHLNGDSSVSLQNLPFQYAWKILESTHLLFFPTPSCPFGTRPSGGMWPSGWHLFPYSSVRGEILSLYPTDWRQNKFGLNFDFGVLILWVGRKNVNIVKIPRFPESSSSSATAQGYQAIDAMSAAELNALISRLEAVATRLESTSGGAGAASGETKWSGVLERGNNGCCWLVVGRNPSYPEALSKSHGGRVDNAIFDFRPYL